MRPYVNGKQVATLTAFKSADYDLSNDRPLRIGCGQTDYFCGKISDVRLYDRTLTDAEIATLATGETN